MRGSVLGRIPTTENSEAAPRTGLPKWPRPAQIRRGLHPLAVKDIPSPHVARNKQHAMMPTTSRRTSHTCILASSWNHAFTSTASVIVLRRPHLTGAFLPWELNAHATQLQPVMKFHMLH